MSELPDTPWTRPEPLGLPEATQAAGTVAAPFLAGFGLTLAVLLLQSLGGEEPAARAFGAWPEWSLGLLVGSAFVLITSVQCTFHARSYHAAPSELADWFGLNVDNAKTSEGLAIYHKALMDTGEMWRRRAAISYNLGVLLLLAGMTTVLVPPGALGDISCGRLVVIGLAAAGLLGEAIWVLSGPIDSGWKRLKAKFTSRSPA